MRTHDLDRVAPAPEGDVTGNGFAADLVVRSANVLTVDARDAVAQAVAVRGGEARSARTPGLSAGNLSCCPR